MSEFILIPDSVKEGRSIYPKAAISGIGQITPLGKNWGFRVRRSDEDTRNCYRPLETLEYVDREQAVAAWNVIALQLIPEFGKLHAHMKRNLIEDNHNQDT